VRRRETQLLYNENAIRYHTLQVQVIVINVHAICCHLYEASTSSSSSSMSVYNDRRLAHNNDKLDTLEHHDDDDDDTPSERAAQINH